jgi:SAM-dependent methyltransferase
MLREFKTALAKFSRRRSDVGANTSAGADPVNLAPRDTSPDAMRRDVDYGMQVLSGFDMWAGGQGYSLKGKRALEVGPGINLVGGLGLKALGAGKVYVSDRWIAPWQPDYNPVFCRMMADRIRAEKKPYDASVFDRVAANGYAGTIQLVECQAEHLSRHIRDPIDAIFSNAVLEHMADHAQTVKSLAAITAPGGIGFHQVDFRYHVDFNRPLDYLLFTAAEHLERAIASNYEIGCQLRPHELRGLFEAAGFTVAWHPNTFAEAAYMQEFLPQLRKSASPYRDTPDHLLKEIGGLYVVRK